MCILQYREYPYAKRLLMHAKDHVVHVRIQWTMETPKWPRTCWQCPKLHKLKLDNYTEEKMQADGWSCCPSLLSAHFKTLERHLNKCFQMPVFNTGAKHSDSAHIQHGAAAERVEPNHYVRSAFRIQPQFHWPCSIVRSERSNSFPSCSTWQDMSPGWFTHA